MADITATLQAKSDQLNASDLIGGPVTVTVERVTGAGDCFLAAHLAAELKEMPRDAALRCHCRSCCWQMCCRPLRRWWWAYTKSWLLFLGLFIVGEARTCGVRQVAQGGTLSGAQHT